MSNDPHAELAARVFGVAVEDVTPEQRRAAKAMTFGHIYGMSEKDLRMQVNPTTAKLEFEKPKKA